MNPTESLQSWIMLLLIAFSTVLGFAVGEPEISFQVLRNIGGGIKILPCSFVAAFLIFLNVYLMFPQLGKDTWLSSFQTLPSLFLRGKGKKEKFSTQSITFFFNM